MKIDLAFRASLVWLLMVCLAILNGAFRDGVLVSLFGHGLALPISGVGLSVLIFVTTYFVFPFLGKHESSVYFLIGSQWVVMTLLFEFFFGHYVLGKPWPEILEVFNLLKGDLYILVLCVSLVSPYLVARLKGVVV